MIESRRRWAPGRFLGSLSEIARVGNSSERSLLPRHLLGALGMVGGHCGTMLLNQQTKRVCERLRTGWIFRTGSDGSHKEQ